MNYLPRNRQRTSYGKPLIVVVAVFILGAGFFSLFGGPLVSLLSPVWRGENAVGRFFVMIGEHVATRGTLVDENLRLKERITSLELQVTTLNLTLSQERSLAELLGRERKAKEVIAAVLTRPPQSPYDLVVIDAGESDGLTVGARVRLPEGPILGTVSDLFPHSAKVKLFTTAGEKTDAILERGNIPVVLEGRGGGNFRIIVPRETVVETGDRVISPDIGYSLLGVVEGVDVEATDSFKEILVKSPANIFSVRLVTIAQ
jgi:cell shape-determining protein MreC